MFLVDYNQKYPSLFPGYNKADQSGTAFFVAYPLQGSDATHCAWISRSVDAGGAGGGEKAEPRGFDERHGVTANVGQLAN